jgi:hypothetical protein
VSGTALRVLKNRGILLKTCKKKTKTKYTSYLNARTRHDPRCGDPRGPPERPSQRPPRAGSASLEGSRLPRAGSASLEGSSPPRSRPPHKHACSRTRVRAFNALTQQSRAIMRLGITPRRCSANSLGETLSYGPPWAHYLGGYQGRLLGGPLGLPGLRYTAPEGVEHKDYGEVLG